MCPCVFAFQEGCAFSSAITAAWVQALGTFFAIGIAIYVPFSLERSRRIEEKTRLIERRRAAWRTMVALTAMLGRKGRAMPAEIQGPAAILDQLDISIFPESAVSVMVGLRNRVAMAQAEVELEMASTPRGDRPELYFDASVELHNLSTIREAMGIGDEPMPEARRPRTLPDFIRSGPAEPEADED